MAKQYITANRASDLFCIDPANLVIVGVDVTTEELSQLPGASQALADVTFDSASNDVNVPEFFVDSFTKLVELSIADNPSMQRHCGNAQPIEFVRVDCEPANPLAFIGKDGERMPYMLVVNYGRKRVRAARQANEQAKVNPSERSYVYIAARAADKRTSEKALAMRRFVENGARVDHDPIAEGQELLRVSKALGLSVDELAKARGESAHSIHNKLGLTKLAPEIKERVSAGEIAPSAAYQLGKLDDHDTQREALAEAESKSVSKSGKAKGKPKHAAVKDAVAARNPRARKPPTNRPADTTAPAPAVESRSTTTAAATVESKPAKPSKPTIADVRRMVETLRDRSPEMAAALAWSLGEMTEADMLATMREPMTDARPSIAHDPDRLSGVMAL